jgi:hypothetical protein
MPTFNCHNKGSILIWTVMLGAILTSVFFFLAMRLRGSLTTQNELIEYQSGKAYLESYADYLAANPPIDGPITFDNGAITGTLTSNLTSIEGILDSGETKTLTGANTFCWGTETDLLKNGAPIENPDPSTCTGYLYKTTGPGTLQAITPVHYKIEGGITDPDKRHLNLDLNLSYGKKLHIYRTLPPLP